MADRRVRRALDGDTSLLATRVMALDDMEILSRAKGGDGRTVVAYAAAFNRSAEIVDSDGHYNEQIAPTAFNASLASGRQIKVFYNHARTLHGTPSESGSVPIGTPAEPPRPDGTGLLTVTRYNKTPLAESVLESIRNGDITGQSFTGVFLQSDPERGPYFSRNGQLTTVTRREIGLIEYGPTPVPAYQDAAIVGVRNREMLMDEPQDPPERTTVTIHVDQPKARTAPEPPAVHERTGVPVHHTDVVDQPWDADENTTRLPDIKGRADAEKYLNVYAWYDASGPDPDHDDLPDTRGSWKLPHHMVAADGTPGAANISGVRNALARAGQMDPPLSSGDETAVKAHLQAHMDDWHKDHPADGGGSGQRTGTVPAAPVQPGPPPKHPVTEKATTPEGGAMSDRQMTVEERAARQEQIKGRLAEIDSQFAGGSLDEASRAEWDELTSERAAHAEAIRDISSRAAYLSALADENPAASVPGADQGAGYGQDRGSRSKVAYGRAPALNRGRPDNLYDVASARNDARSLDDLGRVYRERAKWSIEEATFPGASDDDAAVKGRLERLVARVDDPDTLARNMLLTGSPEYRQAFGKLLITQNPAMLGQAEQRALQMGTPASWSPGSFPVPYQLDPTVILTSSGAINALRDIARVEQIVGKEWLGVTSQGITVSRANELAPASDGTPVLAQPGVAPTRVQAFVPFSVEVEQDWNGLMAEIAMMLADAKDIEEATAFLTGAGTGDAPQGILTGITSGTAQQVLTGTAASVKPDDVYALEDAVPPRFRARAAFLSSKSGYNTVRSAFSTLASAAGDVWVRPSQGTPAELLGYPSYENSNMAGGLTTGTNLMILGDFKQFIIVDRIGMSVELVPHVFSTTIPSGGGTAQGFPQGERGIYAMWRNSSQVLVPNAFRYLQTS